MEIISQDGTNHYYRKDGVKQAAEAPTEDTSNESTDLSRAILDSLRDHVAFLDAQGTILAVNPAWERFAVQNGAPDISQVSVGANYLEICRRAMKSGDPVAQQALNGIGSVLNGATDHFSTDYECSSPTEERWFTMTVLRQTKPVVGAVVVHSDITERKRAEEEIRTSHDKLSTIITGADVGTWDWNIQAGTVEVNERFCAMLGYEPGSFGTDVRRFFDSLHPDDLEKVNQAVEAHFAGESPFYRCDFRLRMADGSYKWIHDAGRLIERDRGGKPLRMVGIHMDLTETKRFEEVLRASEQEFRSMFDLSGVGKAQADPATGRFTRVNRKFCEITGYSEQELLAMTFRDITHPGDRERDEAAVQRVFKGLAESWSSEKRYIRKDGMVLWVQVNGTLIKHNNSLPGSIATVLDITERKRSEETLRSAYKEIRELKERLEAENIYLRKEINVERGFENIIGNSDAAKYVLRRVEQVAPTDAAVLLSGETGVGKELVARAIHQRSLRRDGPLIKVNCAALPESLVESELFGHERGAFTGADKQRKGRFELAHRGTILLDEVAELPMATQSKLLRVLQEGEFERLGGINTIKVDVRVISATNRKLHEEISKGRFRQDLYYRLNVYPITIPPLRQRREDIPLLVQHFVEKLGLRMGKSFQEIPSVVMRELMEYDWPGNVRELENVIERAVIVSSSGLLVLPEPLVQRAGGAGDEPEIAYGIPVISTLDEAEREHLLRALEATGWRINGPKGAAAMLKVHPSTLRFRMKKLGLIKKVSFI